MTTFSVGRPSSPNFSTRLLATVDIFCVASEVWHTFWTYDTMIVVVVKSLHNPFQQLLILHDPKHCFASSFKTWTTSTGHLFIISAVSIIKCLFSFALSFTTTYINTTCYIITSRRSFTGTNTDSKTLFFFCKFFVKSFNTIKGVKLHSNIWLGFQLTITKIFKL